MRRLACRGLVIGLIAVVMPSIQALAQCVGLPAVTSLGSNKYPVGLCAPVHASITYNIAFAFPVPAGTMEIIYDWGDGSAAEVVPVAAGQSVYNTSLMHNFPEESDCEYFVSVQVKYNGVVCTSTRQIQKISSWRTDAYNGGEVQLISPLTKTTEHLVCEGDAVDVVFDDKTDWNCGSAYIQQPPNPIESPNTEGRWQQIIYNTSTESQKIANVTVNDILVTGPGGEDALSRYQDPRGVHFMAAPVLADDSRRRDALQIKAPAGSEAGSVFAVTLRYWNFCNPYDDPNIPGPPSDLINGDHPPVERTAVIKIKPAPVAPTAADQSVCNGVTPNAFAVASVPSGSTVRWYRFDPSSQDAGSLIREGTATSLPITSHPDWVNSKKAGVYHVWASYVPSGTGVAICESKKVLVTRRIREALAVPSPLSPVPTEVCNNASVTISLPEPPTELVGGTTEYTWTTSGGLSIASQTSSSATFHINVTDFGNALFADRTITLTRKFTSAPVCGKAKTFTIRIHRQPSPGVLSVVDDICESQPSGTMTLSQFIGEISRWEVRKDGGEFQTYTGPRDETSISPGLLAPGSYAFRAVVANGECGTVISNEVQFQVSENPFATVSAGEDQFVCASLASAPLNASSPLPGTGVWSYVSSVPAGLPMPAFSSGLHDPQASISIQPENAGAYTLRWTVTNGSCESFDDVVVDFGTTPSVANAGNDKAVCGNETMLEGNVPHAGLGMWSVVSGPGCTGAGCNVLFQSPSSANASVALTANYGLYTFRWTISSGGNNCYVSYDDVQLTFNEPVSVLAEDIHGLCMDRSSLAPILLTGQVSGGIETGEWMKAAGDGTVSVSHVTGTSVKTVTAQYQPTLNDFESGGPLQMKLIAYPVSSSSCSSAEKIITIHFEQRPVATVEGDIGNICTDSTQLNAILPANGASGVWTSSVPGVTFDDPSNPRTVVRNLPTAPSATRVVWTVTTAGGQCVSSPAEVVLTRVPLPDVAFLDIVECEVPPSGSPLTTSITLAQYENQVTSLPMFSRQITWYHQSTTADLVALPDAGQAITNVSDGTQFIAHVRDPNTLCSDTAKLTVKISALPKVNDAIVQLCEDAPNTNSVFLVDLTADKYRSSITNEADVEVLWFATREQARAGVQPITSLSKVIERKTVFARVTFSQRQPACFDIASLTLLVNPIPSNTVIFGRESVCQGDPSDPADKLPVDIYQVTPINGARYYWEIPDDPSSELKVFGGGQEDDFFVMLQFPNVYEGKIRVRTELNGCSGPVVEKNIIVSPSPVRPNIVGEELVCEDAEQITYTVSPNNYPSSSYFWEVRRAADNSLGGAYITNGQSTGDVRVNFGNDDIILSVRESNSICVSAAASKIVRISERPSVTNSIEQGLSGFQFSDGIISTNVTGGVGPYSKYTLIPGNVVNDDGTFSNLSAGSYRVQVEDALGCTSMSDILSLEPFFTGTVTAAFSVTPHAACFPATIQVDNRSTGADRFLWKLYDEGGLVTTSNLNYPSFKIVHPGNYKVKLVATYSPFEVQDSVEVSDIKVYDIPVASFTARTPVYAPDTEVPLANYSERANLYEWNFGDGYTSTEFEPLHAYAKAGEYTITLVAAHDYGQVEPDGKNLVCYDTLSQKVIAMNGSFIQIPNAFTPSPYGPSGGHRSAGFNDVFLPLVEGGVNFHMQVFDRWGTLVFESRDQDIGWDGYNRDGKLMPAGVYVYKLVVDTSDGQHTTRVGDITVIR